MPFATSTSEHPLAGHAAGEVIGAVLEELGPRPDLAVVFASGDHAEQFEAIATAVRELLAPVSCIGATAVSVVGGDREIEGRPALTLWAARIGPCRTVRLEVLPGTEAWTIEGLPADLPDEGGPLLLLADPFTFPADGFLSGLAGSRPEIRVLGGLASAARGPGGNRLVLDGVVHRDGAVGVVLPATVGVTTVVSQGCRPIGDPFTVTRAERNVIAELGSRPTLERLQEIVAALDPSARELAQRGLQLGIVIDEHLAAFGPGDFLIRNVLGADAETGSLTVGDLVPLGATVQFQVRDASTADADLRSLLAGHDADAALLFTCNGRGARFFGEEHHDAALVHRAAGGGPTAGMFCAGELGPVGGRNFLHGYTASVALFTEP